MKLLVTGTAGFIGHFTALNLLKKGHTVIGLDNVNDYYDINLKEARIANLRKFDGFIEARMDLIDREKLAELFNNHKPQRVLNLAAQAGVRYSFENPYAYVDSNLIGFVNLMEDFLLEDLNNAMRKKLKITIQNRIKEQKSKEEFKAFESNLK